LIASYFFSVEGDSSVILLPQVMFIGVERI